VAAVQRGGYSSESDLETYFLHDVPPEVRNSPEARQRPAANAAFESACDFSTWPPVAIRVVAGADDRLLPVEFQQRMARERLGVRADILPAGFAGGRARQDLLRHVSPAGAFVVAAQPTARSVSGDLPGILAQCPVGATLWLRWKTLSGS